MITSLLDYNYSGAYVQELAQKMVYAQIQLAKQGYSRGGALLTDSDGIWPIQMVL